jgi:hypothetical protein
MMNQSNAQREIIAQCKAESCLDRNVPLGMPPAWRPESGPTVVDFYRPNMQRSDPVDFTGSIWSIHLDFVD